MIVIDALAALVMGMILAISVGAATAFICVGVLLEREAHLRGRKHRD